MRLLSIVAPLGVVVAAGLALMPAAMAASAHNLQTGAHTANANDTSEDAAAKQEKQEQQSASRTPWTAFR